MSHPTTRLGRHRRYSPERAWEPLSDTEWAVLSPFVFRTADVAGRPVRDPRGRLDAIFWLAAHMLPGRAPPSWAALPPRFGKPDTVSRQFRRWVKQGLWTKLLQALAEAHYPGIAVLRRLESWICGAFRRAWRLLGVQGMALARRLGFLSALRGPSWLLPNPDLSEGIIPLTQVSGEGRISGIGDALPCRPSAAPVTRTRARSSHFRSASSSSASRMTRPASNTSCRCATHCGTRATSA